MPDPLADPWPWQHSLTPLLSLVRWQAVQSMLRCSESEKSSKSGLLVVRWKNRLDAGSDGGWRDELVRALCAR